MRDERKCGFKKIIKIAMRKIIISCEDYIYLLKCFSLAFWTKSQSESFYTSFPLDLDVPIADSWTYVHLDNIKIYVNIWKTEAEG